MKIVIFVNLVTKHVKISYIIISSNFTPHIRLTLILSLFTLCIGKVKIMLISLKCHVLSPQNAYSFTIFFLSKLKYFGNILYYLWVLKACLGMLGNVLGMLATSLAVLGMLCNVLGMLCNILGVLGNVLGRPWHAYNLGVPHRREIPPLSTL